MTKITLIYLSAKHKNLARQLALESQNRGWSVTVAGPSPFDNVACFVVKTQGQLSGYLLSGSLEQQSVFVACDTASAESLAQLKKQNQKTACAGLYDAEESNVSEVLDRAYDALLLNKWTVGASINSSGKSLILTGERGIKPVASPAEFAKHFLDVVATRINQKHHNTHFEQVGDLPDSISAEVTVALAAIKEWAGWSLFPKYQNDDPRYPGAEFGFVAHRTQEGTLITGRGSNKEEPTVGDLALLKSMDDDGTLHVAGTKLKASLNAPLAHHIFAERPDIKWIVHSHILLPEGVNVPEVSTPGTQSDWLTICEAVRDGANIINQPLHGALILLHEKEELFEILKRNNLYTNQSELYDLAYARFQGKDGQPTHFELSLQLLNIDKDMRVLDLCCGTGASTLGLKNLGFRNIDLADGSPSMLAVAEKRMGKAGVHAPLDNLGAIEDGSYALITMRQAFNYVTPDARKDFLCAVHSKLQEDGKFAFNTFVVLPDGLTPPRDSQHQTDDLLVRTRETNTISGSIVSHFQRSEIIDFAREEWAAIMDVNVFYQHAAADVERDMREAGFGKVEILRQGSSLTFIANKTGDHRPGFEPPQGVPEQPLFR